MFYNITDNNKNNTNMKKLNEILNKLATNKIDVDEAKEQILFLFGVDGSSFSKADIIIAYEDGFEEARNGIEFMEGDPSEQDDGSIYFDDKFK